MRQIGDLNGLVGLQRHTALIEMGLRNHQFGNGFWVSNNQQGFPIARLFSSVDVTCAATLASTSVRRMPLAASR